jgi:polyphosphate glucokinase
MTASDTEATRAKTDLTPLQPGPAHGEAETPSAAGKLTLAIDIGGTRLKGALLDEAGRVVARPARVNTPHPCPPELALATLLPALDKLGRFDRISVGFPGVVRRGMVLTAPNLGTPAWRNFPLVRELAARLGKPGRMLNDATVQGLGVIGGQGLECVLTLGTGMGFALFHDGLPAPQLELGQHHARKNDNYDQYIGNAALRSIGRKKWNRRLKRVLEQVYELVTYDMLYLGGGNAKLIDFDLPAGARVVSNEAGITGGVRLWDAKLDGAFPEEAAEPARPALVMA